jgi:P-type Ca2+ transporter type 2C
MNPNEHWSMQDSDMVCKMLESSEMEGLCTEAAEHKRKTFGYNELEEKKKVSPFAIFASQFRDFMVLVLLGAAVVSGLLGELVDTIAIAAIILINAVLGFVQEYRAEQSMAALREMAAPTAQVIRDGRVQIIPSRLLVPGDVVVLESGDKIPADGRLLEVSNLRIDEAMLTGESKPSKKIAARLLNETAGPADKKNMMFMGTIVTDGRGKAVVTETGMKTEMGQIAHMIQTVEDEQTPLQKKLDQLGRWLVVGCLLICVVVALTGIIRGEDPLIMLMVGISLAVAAIPEGLPAIVTVSLAIGVQKMIRRHALIRSLPAVETLGCTNFICSDKTGTLTENKMTLRKIYTNNNMFDVTGVGYSPNGEFKRGNRYVTEDEYSELRRLLEIGTLASNAALIEVGPDAGQNSNGANGDWTIAGDPTEGAIVVAAAKAGVLKEDLAKDCQRVMELPFDSDRKRMSTVCYTPSSGGLVSVKGAAESLLQLCDGIWEGGYIKKMTNEDRERVVRTNETMAKGALRVLGIAYKDVPDPEAVGPEDAESGLIFAGLVGMIDPPREEARAAIARCDQAGIKTVMITGDHRLTAEAIGRELDILKPGDMILTGEDLNRMSVEELSQQVEQVSVYARVAPHHKLNIVKALKARGNVVAMTGDGVNDAPAVKEAGIGVAMGITGTDVTKESSSMILMDDNFATIVAAVEEGRAIYDNIRKFIRYLLSCNVGEVLTMFIATLMGMPLPLLPIQILWVNLATDGLPAIALGLDPSDKGIMDRAPRGADENVFSRGLSRVIVLRGFVISIITLAAFSYFLRQPTGSLALARTMAFTVLVVSQLMHVFECRSETRNIWEIGPLSNPYLVGAVVSSLVMLTAVVYIPALQPVFRTVALQPGHWLTAVGLGMAGTILMRFLLLLAQAVLGPVPSVQTKRV